MAQSFSNILVHIVFSTKYRLPTLTDDIRDDLHGYIGGIVRNHRGKLIKAGSVSDHIHLLVGHPRTTSPAYLLQEIKSRSSRWLNGNAERPEPFRWQNGYGIFSVSPRNQDDVIRYLSNQKHHHRTYSFKDEYRRILKENGVAYDENVIWD